MPLIQSTTNAFQLVDRTNDVVKLPQNWTLMNDSGMWQEDFLSTSTITFEERNGSLMIVKDQVRGTAPQTSTNDLRKLHSYTTSHHPYADALYPADVDGKTRPGSQGTQLDTADAALLRKLEKARKSFDRTLNFARFRTLADGNIWAPNGTIAGNFYTDFGKTKNVVNFALGTAGTEIIAKCEEIIAGFQAAATEGQVIERVVAYCSPGFFGALIVHPKVQAAYNLNAALAPQQISRDRANGMALYRQFTFSNILFIEVPQIIDGVPLVDANKAVFVAEDGDGSFVTYYSPAQRFGYVNTIAESMYAWTFESPRLTEITIEAEVNFLNVMRHPEFVAGGTVS